MFRTKSIQSLNVLLRRNGGNFFVSPLQSRAYPRLTFQPIVRTALFSTRNSNVANFSTESEKNTPKTVSNARYDNLARADDPALSSSSGSNSEGGYESESDSGGDGAKTHFGYEQVDEAAKAGRVEKVFTNVASRYDLMNDVMSLGIHRLWKNYFMTKLHPTPNIKLLDVAGGTGDIAFRYLNFLESEYGLAVRRDGAKASSSSIISQFSAPSQFNLQTPSDVLSGMSRVAKDVSTLAQNANFDSSGNAQQAVKGTIDSALKFGKDFAENITSRSPTDVFSEGKKTLDQLAQAKSPAEAIGVAMQRTYDFIDVPKRTKYTKPDIDDDMARYVNRKEGYADGVKPDIHPVETVSHSETKKSSKDSSNENQSESAQPLPKSNRSSSSSHRWGVTVCDINDAMLDVGCQKADIEGFTHRGITWAQGDAEKPPFADESFDAYTIAFGIRNCTRLEDVLDEAYRVLRPGGRFMCLEFSHVTNPVLRQAYDEYSFQMIPVLGQIFAGDWKSYQYLVESIRQFPDQEEFTWMIEDAGFAHVRYENLTFGVAAIHSGFKL